MQKWRFASNMSVDGSAYLSGLLGLSLFPSNEAKRNAVNYEADVLQVLSYLQSRFTSSRIIMQISHHPSKQIVIRPLPIAPPDPKVPDIERLYNSFVEPSSKVDAIRQGENAPAPGKDPDEDRTQGTGKGSDAVIKFNPGVYADAMGMAPVYPFGRSDYVLVHELVHALSDVSGVNAETMACPDGYDNLEEFTAIVMRNVYESEVSGSGARLWGGHDGRPLPLLLVSGSGFYNRYKAYMEAVCRNHPLLCRELKTGTNITHNPFVYCSV